MQEAQTQVLGFHLKFRHAAPESIQEITSVPYPTRLFRMERIEEECRELIEAFKQGDIVGTAQEGMDLIYVVLGLFVVLGIPVQPIWDAVHAANMEKVPAGPLEKPIKPPGWVKPTERIRLLIEEMRAIRDRKSTMLHEAVSMDEALSMDWPEPKTAEQTAPCGFCDTNAPGHDHGTITGGFPADEDPSTTGIAEATKEEPLLGEEEQPLKADPHHVIADDGCPHV